MNRETIDVIKEVAMKAKECPSRRILSPFPKHSTYGVESGMIELVTNRTNNESYLPKVDELRIV